MCVCVGGENGECLYLHYYPHITCITIMVVVGVAIVQHSLSIATGINSELLLAACTSYVLHDQLKSLFITHITNTLQMIYEYTTLDALCITRKVYQRNSIVMRHIIK